MYTTAVNDLIVTIFIFNDRSGASADYKASAQAVSSFGTDRGCRCTDHGAAGLEPVCNARYLVKHGVTNDQYCTDYYIIRYRDQ